MADQNITALPVSTTPASSDQLLLVGATEEKLIDYDKLADAILQKLTSKQYTLDQGTKTLPAALNELNSNPFLRYERTYGTSLTVSNVRGATHGLILIGYTLIPFYISGSSTLGYTIATPQLPDGISISNNGRVVTITTKEAQVITSIYPYMK